MLVCPGMTFISISQLHLTNPQQLIPQIVLNHRRHSTEGLQSSMMLLWALAGIPLGVYNITENFNIALRIQAQILTCLSLITWAQCMYYGKSWSKTKSAVILGCMAIFMGGIEAGLIMALRVGLCSLDGMSG
jgi:hypothetical protein